MNKVLLFICLLSGISIGSWAAEGSIGNDKKAKSSEEEIPGVFFSKNIVPAKAPLPVEKDIPLLVPPTAVVENKKNTTTTPELPVIPTLPFPEKSHTSDKSKKMTVLTDIPMGPDADDIGQRHAASISKKSVQLDKKKKTKPAVSQKWETPLAPDENFLPPVLGVGEGILNPDKTKLAANKNNKVKLSSIGKGQSLEIDFSALPPLPDNYAADNVKAEEKPDVKKKNPADTTAQDIPMPELELKPLPVKDVVKATEKLPFPGISSAPLPEPEKLELPDKPVKQDKPVKNKVSVNKSEMPELNLENVPSRKKPAKDSAKPKIDTSTNLPEIM